MDTLLARFRIGSDSGKMCVAATSFAAGELVVRTVVARLGVDDEIAASEGIENHVNKTGTGNDSTYSKY